mgnify:CR=1 FL=1
MYGTGCEQEAGLTTQQGEGVIKHSSERHPCEVLPVKHKETDTMTGQSSKATLVDLHNLQQAEVGRLSETEGSPQPIMVFVQGATTIGRTRVKGPFSISGRMCNFHQNMCY